MENRYKVVVNVLFRLTDATVVIAAWLASYWARFFLPSVIVAKQLPPFERYASLVPLVAVLWILVFSFSGIYESGRLRGRRAEVMHIWRAHLTAVLIFIAIAYTYDEYKYSRLVMVYFAALSAWALAAFRIALRTALRWLRRRGYDVQRVLVVGSGPAAHILVERLLSFPELGMRVTGLLTHDGAAPGTLANAPLLGSFADIRKIVDAERPQHVLIALSPEQQNEIPALLARLGDATVRVRIVPDLRQYAALDYRVEAFEGMPVIRLDDSPIESLASLAKRCLDICLSAFGLVVAFPVLLSIAVLVKLTSPGPVIYAQERMGLDGRTFKMLKFRSMRADAEAKSGAVWAKPTDDRRTRFGTFLRKTSLDELPQLWNVFVGHMSLVGPRPERPVFVQEFRSQIPHYMLRHKVKAGITGWAQVNGWRGNTSLVERTACDLYYIRNWSLQFDIKILTMTVWKGFINKNAY